MADKKIYRKEREGSEKMPSSTDVAKLIINTVPSQEIYDQMVTQGLVNQNELYLIGGTMSGYVPTAQGVANAGKFLVVGSDGNVTLVTLAAWQGGSY